jgi:co-chaperonin GroES (HSP10)
MTMTGDALASGAKTAKFESGGRGLTDCQYDYRVMTKEHFLEKYDVSSEAYDHLDAPDELKVRDGWSPIRKTPEAKEPVVIDRRPKYEPDPLENATWTVELIATLTPQQYKYRYQEDPRFWMAVHKLTPHKCSWAPLGDIVILERIPEKRHFLDKAEVTAEKSLKCIVIAASKKAQAEGVNAGDTVMIRSYTGTGISVDDYMYETVPYQDILFRISDPFASF